MPQTMDLIEAMILAGVLTGACLPLLGLMRRVRRAWPQTVAATALFGFFTAAAVSSVAMRPPPINELDITYRPIRAYRDGEISSETCRACHPREHATWHKSFHRTMTQVATPQTVRGDFDDVTLRLRGYSFQLSRKGDEYWINMSDLHNASRQFGPSIRRVDKRVVMITGSHHMQIYWYPTGEARKLGQLPFVYLIKEQKWIPRSAAFLKPTPQGLEDETGRWNAICVQCHTTQGRPLIDLDNGMMETRVTEFGISCQACHTEGRDHVELNRDPQRRYQFHLSNQRDTSMVQPQHLTAQRSTQVCGQCHGLYEHWTIDNLVRYNEHGPDFRAGDDLEKKRLIIQQSKIPRVDRMRQIAEGNPGYMDSLFWSDGMVRVSGREYNGLLETPCFNHNDEPNRMSCLSCHTMHAPADDRPIEDWTNDQLKAGMRSNQACTQCHDKDYDTDAKLVEHTHHEPDSTGSLCYNCHMPYTTYGLLKAIRSHTVDNPTVQASIETGRPNACNQCHLDKTLAWTSGHLKDWYGKKAPTLDEDQQKIAASVLWLLKGDAGQRALMAWSYGWETARAISGEDWMAPYLVQLLVDPYEAVRYIANRSLHRLPRFKDFDYNFLEPSQARQSAWLQGLVRWGKADQSTGDAILIDHRGALQLDEFQRLFDQRDNRPVKLNE